MDELTIRLATLPDCQSILNIYSHYVLNTAITFEYEIPALEEVENRMKSIQITYPYLVAEIGGEIVGYAYATDLRYRTAYQWSPESTIYLQKDAIGQGIGKKLYNKLIEILKIQGFYNVFGGVALPNEASIALHLNMGFTEIGIYKNIGYKHDKWHSTLWFQLQLNEYTIHPETPKKISDINFKI